MEVSLQPTAEPSRGSELYICKLVWYAPCVLLPLLRQCQQGPSPAGPQPCRHVQAFLGSWQSLLCQHLHRTAAHVCQSVRQDHDGCCCCGIAVRMRLTHSFPADTGQTTPASSWASDLDGTAQWQVPRSCGTHIWSSLRAAGCRNPNGSSVCVCSHTNLVVLNLFDLSE